MRLASRVQREDVFIFRVMSRSSRRPGEDRRSIAAACRRGAKHDGGGLPYHLLKRKQRYPETRQISYHRCRCSVALMEHAHGTERWRMPLWTPRRNL